MDASVAIGPAGAFLAVALFALGWYRYANRPGVIARVRVSAYANRPGQPAVITSESLRRERRRMSGIGAFERLLSRKDWAERLSSDLARAGIRWRVAEYLLLRWTLALLAAFAVSQKTGVPILGLAAAAAGYFAPAVYVRWRQKRRTRQFDDQLVEALVLIANALKSGFSFMQGMQAIVDEMPDPISLEFAQALGEARAGSPVEDALLGISDRVRSADFELVATAMLIQRQVGGNLAEILSNIVETVRERHRIQREVRVLSAEQRLSGNIIGLLPVALIVLLSLTSPSYITGMLNDPNGKFILAGGFSLEMLGFVIIRKLVTIEV